MNFDNKLLNDIEIYCNFNELDVDEFANNLLRKAFMLEKYGNKPSFMIKKEQPEKKEETPEPEIVGADMDVGVIGERGPIFMLPEGYDSEKLLANMLLSMGVSEENLADMLAYISGEKKQEEKQVEEPKETAVETLIKEENDGEEENFKLIEKKVKKPRKRKLT